MLDQASQLRNLVLRSLREQASGGPSAPPLVLVAGGKGGVGTTTVAVNLSLALALYGWRVVLVDADQYRADVAPLCGLEEPTSVADVLSGRREIHEVLQRGPAGLLVVPGLWAPEGQHELSEIRQHRLLRQLASLRRHADAIVLDGGNGAGHLAQLFWRAAHQIVLVTTPDSLAVMDTYATIKTLRQPQNPPIWITVNRVAPAGRGEEVFQRIEQSCQRFLQLPVQLLGTIHDDPAVPEAAAAGRPLLLSNARSPAAQQIQAAAARLSQPLEGAGQGMEQVA